MTRDDEQDKALDLIRKELRLYKKALAVACTGYGKGHLIKKISEGLKSNLIVIVPRVNLVEDIAGRIGDCSIFCAALGKKEIGKITVSTKQSIEKLAVIDSDLIILDECHSYKDSFLDKIKSKFVIGFTATPFDDEGFIWERDYWNKPCYEFGIKEAIKRKYLCPYIIYGAKTAYKIKKTNSNKEYTKKQIDNIVATGKTKNQVNEIVEIAARENRKKIAILCANIEHAEKVNSLLPNSVVVHSKQKNPKENIDNFKTNARFCVSVMMLSEGFDFSEIDMVVFLRPTRSTRLMMQACGRGLRNGTEDCIFLDFGDVFINCGFPDAPVYQFTKKSESAIKTVKQCEECYYMYEATEKECPSCGHENKVERDVLKGLNESVMKTKPVVTVRVMKYMFIETKSTARKARYAVFRTNKKQLYFFGKHYKTIMNACVTNNLSCTVKYTEVGKFPKIISVEIDL